MKEIHKIPVQYFLAIVLGLGAFGALAGSAQAFSLDGVGGMMGGWGGSENQMVERQQAMFQEEASLLGVSLDEIKDAWAQGKSFKQLAADRGITPDQLKQKIKDAALTSLKTRLQTLVDKGVITSSQMSQRLEYLKNSKVSGHAGRMMDRGMHGFAW